MKKSDPFAIVSPECSGMDSEDNDIRVESMRLELDKWGVDYKEVVGCFDGRYEVSFVLRNPATARLFGLMYNQESVLRVDANRQAWSANPGTGDETYLGPWSETYTPELHGSFTYDPSTKRYFVAEAEV